jgi:hypothetical protein
MLWTVLRTETPTSGEKTLTPATHYQVDLICGPDQVYLSGLPDREWSLISIERYVVYFSACLKN